MTPHEKWQSLSVLLTGVSNACLWGVVLSEKYGRRK
jgi:hypothetical protein